MNHALVAQALWEEEKQRARRATKRKLKRCPTDLDALVEESEESETEPAAKDANVPNNIYSASHFQGSGNVTSDSGDTPIPGTPPSPPTPPYATDPPTPPPSPTRRSMGRTIRETALPSNTRLPKKSSSLPPPPPAGTRLSEEEEGVGFVAGRETCMGKYVQPCRTAGKSYYDTVWFRVLLVFLLLVSLKILWAQIIIPIYSHTHDL